jgi:hypothetical protein
MIRRRDRPWAAVLSCFDFVCSNVKRCERGYLRVISALFGRALDRLYFWRRRDAVQFH